jgi:formate-dependent nitrite reductase membrane component NrfD
MARLWTIPIALAWATCGLAALITILAVYLQIFSPQYRELLAVTARVLGAGLSALLAIRAYQIRGPGFQFALAMASFAAFAAFGARTWFILLILSCAVVSIYFSLLWDRARDAKKGL